MSLMKCLKKQTSSTHVQIMIELSKECLYESLRHQDSYSDSIYCILNLYLAALHYTTGQCRMAIDHCRLLMARQTHSNCRSHVILVELLPAFVKLIEVFAFLILYRFSAGQIDMHVRCSIVGYETCIDRYAGEILHYSIIEKPSIDQNILKYAEMAKPTVLLEPFRSKAMSDLLIQCACQHLRILQLSLTDCGFICTSVCEYRAVYLYNKGWYEQALKECRTFFYDFRKVRKKTIEVPYSLMIYSSLLLVFDNNISIFSGFLCLVNNYFTFMEGWSNRIHINSCLFMAYLQIMCLVKLKSTKPEILNLLNNIYGELKPTAREIYAKVYQPYADLEELFVTYVYNMVLKLYIYQRQIK